MNKTIRRMNILGIIPSRMASTRFPGKPLAAICGIPMVGHVYYRSIMSKALTDTYVATCDKEIYQYIESIGGKTIMTSASHERACDRVAEAMLKIEKKTGAKIDIVVMIQGDEPMLFPKMIDMALGPVLRDRSIEVVNLMAPLKSIEEYEDPHEVKVVVDNNNFALYFSREPIPSRKKCGRVIPMYKQVAIIPFRRNFLIKFNKLTPTKLEKIESVDMLRILEHGLKIKMVFSEYLTYSVDSKQDLEKVERLMKNDVLLNRYIDKVHAG